MSDNGNAASSAEALSIRVGTVGFDNLQFEVLGYLLYPYKVELSQQFDGRDVIVCKGVLPDSSKPFISIHCGMSESAELPDQEVKSVDLAPELIDSSSRIFETALNPSVALRYRLATSFPFPYGIIPSPIRNMLLRIQAGPTYFDMSRYLQVETCRRTIVEAFGFLGFTLRRKYSPSLVITHDVETAQGLQKALRLKKVEEQLELNSTWFLPSDEYPLNRPLTLELADSSVIGSHDTKHDGKLIQVQKHSDLVRRLKRSRLRLEDIIGKTVDRFRSPLLQFSRSMIKGLSEAGYKQDFSAPTWEPVNPVTMGGFGVGSVHAFEVDGIVEVPLTLTQDHQLFNVLGLSPREATKLWTEQAKLVCSLGGDIVLLVHPDYLLSQDLPEYRRLLGNLLEVHLNRSEADQKGFLSVA